MPDDLFDGIDLSLPDEQLAEWLAYVLEKRVEVDEAQQRTVLISDDELKLLQEWARNAGSKTREEAANFLFWNGPCEWDDLASWILDPDPEVRHWVIGNVLIFGESSVGGRLCDGDAARCVLFIGASAERYLDTADPIWALRDFAVKGGEWLELSWREANRLLDLNDVEMNTQLICGYFEHVIPDLKWGPDDPHIRSWVSGNDGWRQMILLRVATWMGLGDGRLRDIVQALTAAKDKRIASLAVGVLAGRVGYSDL